MRNKKTSIKATLSFPLPQAQLHSTFSTGHHHTHGSAGEMEGQPLRSTCNSSLLPVFPPHILPLLQHRLSTDSVFFTSIYLLQCGSSTCCSSAAFCSATGRFLLCPLWLWSSLCCLSLFLFPPPWPNWCFFPFLNVLSQRYHQPG